MDLHISIRQLAFFRKKEVSRGEYYVALSSNAFSTNNTLFNWDTTLTFTE